MTLNITTRVCMTPQNDTSILKVNLGFDDDKDAFENSTDMCKNLDKLSKAPSKVNTYCCEEVLTTMLLLLDALLFTLLTFIINA